MRGWLKTERNRPLGTSLGTQVQRVETMRDATGEITYHIVYLQPSGFVIVAGEDLIDLVTTLPRRFYRAHQLP